MSITNGYATVADVQAVAADVAALGTAATATLERGIESASRAIDTMTGRVFYASGAGVSRFYPVTRLGNAEYVVETDDLISISAVATDGDKSRAYATSWTSTDYFTSPRNGVRQGRAWPIEGLVARPGLCFPWFADGYESVKVTGNFGFGSAVPTEVVQATIQLSLRLFMRFKSPTGIQGGADFGAVYVSRQTDPDIWALVQPFAKSTKTAFA